jgi:two-component system chemotaxis response regulator CheY
MFRRVLIVDDSSLARRTARQVAEELGLAPEEATDGVQALERYSINRHDVVILDLVMNGMYGLEVLTKLRQFDPPARVIVLTADVQSSTVEEARKAGASGLLNKPVNRAALLQLLETVLAGGVAWN